MKKTNKLVEWPLDWPGCYWLDRVKLLKNKLGEDLVNELLSSTKLYLYQYAVLHELSENNVDLKDVNMGATFLNSLEHDARYKHTLSALVRAHKYWGPLDFEK